MGVTIHEARAQGTILLREWKTDTLENRWQLVEKAEEIEEQLQAKDLLPADGDNFGVAGLVASIYDIIANAAAQMFLPVDVPAALQLLEAPAGQEDIAIANFNKYWEQVDFEVRAREASQFWYGQSVA